MGDRICLTFVKKGNWNERSPVMYAHWDGKDLLDKAKAFFNEYIASHKVRDEPSNVMVNFICYLREGRIEDGNYYLYRDENTCCSPDDNGFWELDVETGDVRQLRKGEWEA